MEPTISLQELIGQKVLACIPTYHKTDLEEVTLHGVEVGGIWIESEIYTKMFLEKMDLHATRTPIFFVPYNQILVLIHPSEKIALSEKKFGL